MAANRCFHADKAYSSQKHRGALKSRGIKNGIKDKVARNNPLTRRQLQRNGLITEARYVVERTFGNQVGGSMPTLRYRGKALVNAWHTGYGIYLKRLSKLFADCRMMTQT